VSADSHVAAGPALETGVAIECATERIEVLVASPARSRPAAPVVEHAPHGHTRRLTAVVRRALEESGVAPADLAWVAVDLGPGSFTGVRVGLATAHALALASGARVLGASSLAALALGLPPARALIVPLVPAGRADAYAGFFRGDGRGPARVISAPRVLALPALLDAITEARRAGGLGTVRCIGPGAARWREPLEESFPHATSGDWRFEGLAAADLLAAAHTTGGPASGLPAPGAEPSPVYVRSAQAEERVRHRVSAALPALTLRAMEIRDVPAVAAVEHQVFSDPWPESFFLGELAQPLMFARVAEREGRLVGYSVAWLGAGTAAGAGSGHLGNLAVTPEERRRGVATALLADLLSVSTARGVGNLTLEVRATNDAAQALYRAHGFRLAGVRRGYYRDTGEDAMVMEWRAEAR
jgi:ribosomal-protein-alanine acetyltransferase/tRNA threonylcarbamoyl adenosine modification protein YeaZ